MSSRGERITVSVAPDIAELPSPVTDAGVPRWVPISLTALLIAVVTRQAARPITDPDSFWHLRLGALIRQNGDLNAGGAWAIIDGQPWVPTQWLPEVVAASLENRFGLAGVAWLFGVGLVALTLAVYVMCRKESGLTAAAVATGLTVAGMSASLSPRPHMVTYLFLVITVVAWMQTSRDLRPRWWLIALTWIWACSHGMWFTGVIAGLAVVIGIAIDGRTSRRRLALLAAVPLGSLAAAAVTPVGPRLLLAPVAVSGVGDFIAEWQPPAFTTLGPAITMLMIATVIGTWARHSRPTPWPQLLLLGVSIGWTLLAARTVTLGAIIVAPLTAAAIQTWLKRPAEPRARSEIGLLLTFASICLMVLALVVPRTSEQPAGMPTDLNDELAALPADSVILNSYEVGGWLRWEHPQLHPVVDGLTEAYSTEHLLRYGQVTSVSSGWDQAISSWQPEYAVIGEGSPLATALLERMEAEPITSGQGYVLLRLGDRRS